MVYLKYGVLWCSFAVLKVVNFIIAPFIVLLGSKEVRNNEEGSYLPRWLSWFQTWDNPLEGDESWINRKSPFPNTTTGLKGWWNKACWLWRNSCYGFSKDVLGASALRGAVVYSNNPLSMSNLNIGDRNGKAGSYLIFYTKNNKKLAFEYYLIRQYKKYPNKCLRIRLGWKLNSSKFDKNTPAQFVATITPWKEFNNKQ